MKVSSSVVPAIKGHSLTYLQVWRFLLCNEGRKGVQIQREVLMRGRRAADFRGSIRGV